MMTKRFVIYHTGNFHEFVIKDMVEQKTIGVFNDTDEKRVIELAELLNQLGTVDKEFELVKHFAEYNGINVFNIPTAFCKCWDDNAKLVDRIRELEEKNEELNSELNKYYKRFDCHQCHYHNYDGLNIDDEYEVCDKGNDEALDDNHSCSEWEEL